jgi:hypothetical protein
MSCISVFGVPRVFLKLDAINTYETCIIIFNISDDLDGIFSDIKNLESIKC